MSPLDLLQVWLQPPTDPDREDRPPIFLALSALDEDFVTIEVQVLHPKLQTLEQPQPGPIEQRRDNPGCPFEVREHAAHLVLAGPTWWAT